MDREDNSGKRKIRSGPPMAARRMALLNTCFQAAARAAQEVTGSADHAHRIAARITEALCEQWAGQQITFPSQMTYALAVRERVIFDAHKDGVSVATLARDYRLSDAGVRMLIKRVGRRLEILEARSRQSNQPLAVREDSP